MLLGELALVATALFTGAAIYVNAVEHPARAQLEDRSQLVQWKPSYERATVMQASLAVLGFLLGVAAWWFAGRAGFLVGALLMLGNGPWTFLVIFPINRRLMATDPVAAGPESRALLARWNRLHAVRSGLGVLAIVSFLVALA